jgi:hypothetical protein
MRMKLALGGNVIASIPLIEEKAASLEYIYDRRSLLAEACAHTIAAQTELPEYFIEVSSRMNNLMQE